MSTMAQDHVTIDPTVHASTIIRRFRRSIAGMTGLTIAGLWVLIAIFTSWITPYDPLATDPVNILQGPSAHHWFGTDNFGRDVLSRLLAGSRDILVIAPLATIIGLVVGTVLGLTMAYFHGFVDTIVGRLLEAILALPTIVVALVALAALGTSKIVLIFVIGFVFTPFIARTVRSGGLLESRLEYIDAARARGENAAFIMFREMLPNVVPLVVVEGTVRLGYAIFAVATLSFIGFGIQPPSPDWGLTMSENYGLLNGGYWWPTVFPAVAIASLVISVNLVSDGLKESNEL